MEAVQLITTEEINKRRYSSILVISIYATQASTAAILSAIAKITGGGTGGLQVVYYLLTLAAAIPQAGFSDDYGRKRHLVISSICILSSLIVIFGLLAFKTMVTTKMPNYWPFLAVPPILLLGIAGNAIPIARGCLASLKLHDFRSSIGFTSVFIGFGWVSVNLLSLIVSTIWVVAIVCLLQLIIVITILTIYNENEAPVAPNKPVLTAMLDSYKWCWHMLFIVGGSSAIIAYLLSETSFYQMYLLDELQSTGKKVVGILMGFAYFTGVVSQWVVYPSDKKAVTVGVIWSFVSVVAYALFHMVSTSYWNMYWSDEAKNIINGVVQCSFAFGFGFFVPALFSLMSKRLHPEHTGRLYGAIDTTDTMALGGSSLILFLRGRLEFDRITTMSMTVICFALSMVFYKRVNSKFESYEEPD